MLAKILCPDCGAPYQVPENNLGRVATCKRCSAEFRLGPETRADGPASTSPDESINSARPTMSDEALPGAIGRYQVLRSLGKGGMGTVYLAHDPHLKREVALKVPHPEQIIRAEARERFFREAQAAARLDHPNFCKIHDIGEADGVPFLAMAYIEGRTLAASIEPGKPWEPRRAAEVVRDLALALAEAHRLGIVHRDLKPANVMIDAKGRLVIMDFGLARRVDAADHPTLTVAGSILGTPAYMSPEQADGDVKAIGPASDIYSLGVVLYELLSGCLPFIGSRTMVLAQILMAEPPPPSEHHPAVEPKLESICLKAMAKDRGARFASMEAFAGALKSWLDSEAEVLAFHDSPDSAVALQSSLEGDPGLRPVQTTPSPAKPLPAPILDSTRGPTAPKAPRPSRKRPLNALLLFLASVGLFGILAIFLGPTLAMGIVLLTAVGLLVIMIRGFTHHGTTAEIPPLPKPEPVPSPDVIVTPSRPAPPPKPEPVPSPDAIVTPSRPAPPFPTADQFVNSIGMKLKLIPAGEFDMGARDGEPGAQTDEKPRHRVRITRPFYLGVHEVSQARYRQVMGTDPSWFSARGGDRDKVLGMDTSRHPVENVSWFDAVAFCNTLSGREGLRLCYRDDGTSIPDGDGYRLPTEAEWEYACRAGAGGAGAYSFGDDAYQLGRYAWYDANSDGKSNPVGRKSPNAFGLFDMHGNVWEWCADWYDSNYYAKSPLADPLNSTPASDRVARGGGWLLHPRGCRSADRGRHAPGYRGNDLGFRVARGCSGQ